MSIPSFTTPVLDYVGSVDVSSSDYGTNQFIISVDPTMNTLGSLLMFEYKLQNAGTATTPATVTLGYINMDAGTSFQLGSSSQYQIGVPAEANVSIASRQIQIRAYSGLLGATDIVVSPWSNELTVMNPPEQPVIFLSYYDLDVVSGEDDLFIFMDPLSNLTYDWDRTKFVVAYYFATDPSDVTVWQVSEPLPATNVVYSLTTPLKMLQVPGFGSVSLDPTKQVVYVSVYAIDSFEYSTDMYYSVSHISTTESALPQEAYASPTITSIDYAVYQDNEVVYPGNQIMTVNWLAPLNTLVPTFTVERYILEYATDVSGTWFVVDDEIPPTTLSWPFNPWVTAGIECGNTVFYRVRAVSTNGTYSPYSNLLGENIFSFSTPPENLIVSGSFDNDLVSLTVFFDNPLELGCGTPYQYVVTAYDNIGGSVTQYVPYHLTPDNYTVYMNDLALAQIGTVDVYLQTYDTNSPNALNGQVSSAGYIGIGIILEPVNYLIYSPSSPSQFMALTWSVGALPEGWTLSNYDVYMSLNDASFNLITSTASVTYDYSVTQDCTDNLRFQISAVASYGGVNFNIVSNIEEQNVFKYSNAPDSTIIDWTFVNDANTLDMLLSWTNPTYTGCGTPSSFLIQLYDSSALAILPTYTIPYVSTPGHIYQTYLNDITYTTNGTVLISLQTQDTNNGGILRKGNASTSSFISQDLPVINGVIFNVDHTELEFDVQTAGDLVLVNRLIIQSEGTPFFAPPIFSYQTQPVVGQSVVKTSLPNGISNYHFTIGASVVDAGTFSSGFGIVMSNQVGTTAYQAVF